MTGSANEKQLIGAVSQALDDANRQEAIASRARRNAVAMAVNAGLSQRKIARALGMTQPTVSYLLNHSATRDAAGRPISWMTARDTTRLVRELLGDGDEQMAFRVLVQGRDHLLALGDRHDVAEWAVEPARIPDTRFDTLFRALALLVVGQITGREPSWAPPRRLAEPWVLARPSQMNRALTEAPDYLQAVNVFLTPESLVNA